VKSLTGIGRSLSVPFGCAHSAHSTAARFASQAIAQGEAALKHTPYGKQGSGFYTDATRGCFDVINRLRPPVLKAVEEALGRRTVARDFTTPFRILDLGTADAGTSMPLVRECAKMIQGTPGFARVPIEVIYEDQPGNDWNSVFARTQGTVSTPNVPEEAGGLSDLQNCFVLASGSSFYNACCSPGTVDVAFCATAFHWLTSIPVYIPDALHAACTEDPATLQAFRKQADADWQKILAARGRELKPGARLVIANFAKDVDGHFLGFSARTESMHHNFARIWQGLVTPAEFQATNFPNHYRSLEECIAPFRAAGVFEGLKLLEAETAIVPCPYLDGWLADPSKRTPAEQAAHYVPTTRTWSNSTFLAGLAETRSPQEKEAVVDELFSSYAAHVSKDPSKHGMDYVHSYLVLEADEAKRAVGSGKIPSQTRGISSRALRTVACNQLTVLPTSAQDGSSVLSWSTPCGAKIYIAICKGSSRTLSRELPGNGGLRIWDYANADAAITEAIGLAAGMESKHSMYNTGFAGTKVVVDARKNDDGQFTIDKRALMMQVGQVLNDLDGTVYTGCDMNSNHTDMEFLFSKTPYVLAGIPHLTLDPNDATAFGVLGSLEALADRYFGGVKGTSFVVHGLGNVGGTVARQLLAAGASVSVYDTVPERAAGIPGTIDLTTKLADNPNWASALPEHSIFVPCSKSSLIDVESALALPAKAICGSTNMPFASVEAENAFIGRRGTFIPESISSAGAVIIDSVEHFQPKNFKECSAKSMYEFCRSTTYSKTAEALSLCQDHQMPMKELVSSLIDNASSQDRIGNRFGTFDGNAASLSQVLDSNACHSGPKFGSSTVVSSRRSYSSAVEKPQDVCIVGAGIMGMNIAYQMKRRDPSLNVTVLERAPALGFGSSGWSTGFLRAFYSFDNTMELALDGINAYKNWGAYTGLGDEAEAYFTHTGALWMLGKSKADNLAIQDRLKRYKVESEVLDADGISHRFPALNTEPYPEFNTETGEIVDKDWGELWAVYEHGCGHMDSSSCLRDIHKACERVGVNFVFNARVQNILSNQSASQVEGVKLVDGSMVMAGVVLNCAGPWFQSLNQTAGVKTSTEMLPTRIQVGHLTLPDDEDLLSLPFVADAWGNSGIYFMPRRGNKQLVFGSVAHRFESEVVDPDNFNEALDPDVKADYLGCLLHRCPKMPQSGGIAGFSHMYTVNQDDVHPVIGPAAELKNYFLCNGFSGHGFKLAPAVGSMMSQQILGTTTSEFETAIPLDFMDPNRKALVLQVKTHFA